MKRHFQVSSAKIDVANLSNDVCKNGCLVVDDLMFIDNESVYFRLNGCFFFQIAISNRHGLRLPWLETRLNLNDKVVQTTFI